MIAGKSTFLAQGALTAGVFTLGGVLYLLSPVILPESGTWYLLMAFVWCVALAGYNYYPTLRRRRSPRVHPAVFEGPVESYLDIQFWVLDRRLRVVEAGGNGIPGYAGSATDLVGRRLRELPGFDESVRSDLARVMEGEELSCTYTHGGITYRTQFFPIRNLLGDVTCCSCITINLSNLYQLDADRVLAEQVIEHASDAIVVADARRRVMSVNSAFSVITGYGPEDVAGRKRIVPHVSGFSFDDLRRASLTLQRRGSWEGEINARRRTGEPYIARVSVSVIRDGGRVTHYLVCFADISRLKQEQDQLTHLANHDFLTGLPNRRLFLDRLGQAIKRARRQQKLFALYFVDLDNFKLINDSFGHRLGDDVLCQVAGRLTTVTRESDTVARLSGDEFIVLVEQVEDDHEIVDIGRKLLACFQPPFLGRGREIHCRASLGISVFPVDGESLDILMAIADAGMYRAKETSTSSFYFRGSHYETSPVAEELHSVDIRRALHEKEFELHYQPQIDLKNNAIIGCEVLVRWNYGNGRQLLPGQFLPLVEEGKLVSALGRWVLKTAVTQYFHWCNQGIHPGSLSINLAPDQLRDEELLNLVEELVEMGLIRHEQLRFEVSVDLAIQQPALVESFFRKTGATGVSCALDEFGVQEAGFDLLNRLRVDLVKLDRSLIQASRGSSNAKAVIAAIAALGDARGFAVVGMGVEQQGQLENLDRTGCHLVQGYYYAPSLNVEDFNRFYHSFHQQTAS